MDNKKNRQGNIRLPYNIWKDHAARELRDSERVCEECGGCGGYGYPNGQSGLIKRCDICGGRGYFDWIHTAKGTVKEEYSFFITRSSDQISAAVKRGEEEKYIKQIELQLTGTFKFKSKDDI